MHLADFLALAAGCQRAAEETQEGKTAENNKKAKERKSRGRAGITLKASERKGEDQRQKAGGNEKGQTSNQSREMPESKEEKGTAGSRGSKRRKNDAEEPCMGWGSGGRSLFPLPPCICTPKYPPSPGLKVQVAEAGGGLGVNYA